MDPSCPSSGPSSGRLPAIAGTDRPGLTRRTFLGAAGIAAVAVACGGDDTTGTRTGDATTTSAPGLRPLNAQVATQDLHVGGEQRLALGVFRLKADQTIELVQGDEVLVTLSPPNGTPGPPQAATFHADGLPPDRGVYVTHAVFDVAGFWDATVTVGDLSAAVAFEVKEEPSAPAEGDTLPSVKTPTTADSAGVDPICTRTPPCPFHTISLDEALANDLPTVVMISTPAFCVSRICGPVLDLLIDLAPEFDPSGAGGAGPGSEARANFVHIEVWKSNEASEFSPGVAAFKIDTEPWVFGADPEGAVVARLDGAFDRVEVRQLIEAAVGVTEADEAEDAPPAGEG